MFRDMTDEQLVELNKLVNVRVGNDNALTLFAVLALRIIHFALADETARRIGRDTRTPENGR